jgi:nitrogen fixation/metabolism regulation signal transduction histidine kinase
MALEKRSFYHRYLVDKRFQFKYTMMIVGVSSLIYGYFAYRLYENERAKTAILQIRELDVRGMVEQQDLSILYYLLGFFALQVVSLLALGILITHRIAGPVHRVQKYLEEVAETGELKPLDPVRNRDEFREFFGTLSLFIQSLQKKMDELRRSKNP